MWRQSWSLLFGIVIISCTDCSNTVKQGVELDIIRSTMKKTSTYFEGRSTVGRQPALPFLCYSLLSKQTEYSILLSNIAVFGHRCEWVLTYKVSGSFRPNTSEVISVGLRHGSKIIQQNLVDTGRLMKTFAWKDVVLSFALQYSHMWLIDADIEFKSSNELDNYITSWFCGSVAGFPPLISQPTVRAAPGAARQDYLEVNHYSVYSRSGLSTIKSKVVENQVVLADMSFLNWYYQEVIGPYFEKIRSFNNTDWGLTRTWCQGAAEYSKRFMFWYRKKTGQHNLKLPLACGIIPHYVTHHNTRGINKTTTFQRHGKYMYSQIDRMFPLWSVDRSDEWQPVALVQQGENARREHLRNGHTQRLSTAPYDVRPIVVRDIANVRSRIHREGILQSKCSVTFSINYNNHSHAYFWLIFHRNK